MAKSKTSSFVLTLPLMTEKFQEDILHKRIEIGRKIYNSCISEYYKRLNLLKQSKKYNSIMKQIKRTYREESKIKHLNKKNKSKTKYSLNERKTLYKQINSLYTEFGLTEYSMYEYVKPMAKIFKKNLDSQSIQKIASRA